MTARTSGELSDLTNGLGLEGRLPDLMRLSIRSLISWPPSGAAVTVVLAEALGGGVGLLVRNRGWIWSSLGALDLDPCRDRGTATLPDRETGPEREPGLEKLCWRGVAGGGPEGGGLGGGNIVEKLGRSSGRSTGLVGTEFG